MKTLEIRVERQNQSALQIAAYLERHPAVARVFYPGLTSHPQHDIARRQMPGGFGGVMSFVLHGDYEVVKGFLPKLKFAHRAANLGTVETVVGPPATTSHVEVSAKDRAAMGIPEALVRYSTGIENVSDSVSDLEQALVNVPVPVGLIDSVLSRRSYAPFLRIFGFVSPAAMTAIYGQNASLSGFVRDAYQRDCPQSRGRDSACSIPD